MESCNIEQLRSEDHLIRFRALHDISRAEAAMTFDSLASESPMVPDEIADNFARQIADDIDLLNDALFQAGTAFYLAGRTPETSGWITEVACFDFLKRAYVVSVMSAIDQPESFCYLTAASRIHLDVSETVGPQSLVA